MKQGIGLNEERLRFCSARQEVNFQCSGSSKGHIKRLLDKWIAQGKINYSWNANNILSKFFHTYLENEKNTAFMFGTGKEQNILRSHLQIAMKLVNWVPGLNFLDLKPFQDTNFLSVGNFEQAIGTFGTIGNKGKIYSILTCWCQERLTEANRNGKKKE